MLHLDLMYWDKKQYKADCTLCVCAYVMFRPDVRGTGVVQGRLYNILYIYMCCLDLMYGGQEQYKADCTVTLCIYICDV